MYNQFHARDNRHIDARANALAQAASYHPRQGDAQFQAVCDSITATLTTEFPAIAPDRLSRRANAALRRRSNWSDDAGTTN